MAKLSGFLVVLEGPDKSGKSTQAGLLVKRLRDERHKVLHTREPGGTTFAEEIRRILLHPKHTVSPLTELFLYEAARAQHTLTKLKPALLAGRIVVSERYTMATMAYQGYGRGLDKAMIRKLNAIASEGLKPDLTIILDIPVAEFGSRRRLKHDRLELEAPAFRKRVRKGYRELARQEPRTALLDATTNIKDLHEKIYARVKKALR